ncbi:hypothetical protein ACHAXT_007596 [Thalassiosira profunda]
MSHRFRSRRRSRPLLLTAALHLVTSPVAVDAFLTCKYDTITHQSRPAALRPSKIIDAEVIPDDDGGGGSGSGIDPEQSLVEYSQNQDPEWKSMPVAFCDADANTYIDCNLAFYAKDPLGDDSGGAEYALGVPCEVPVVVALELGEGGSAAVGGNEGDAANVINLSKVIPLSPDDDGEGSNVMADEEKEEVFQMAARALMDEFGEGIRLKKTPRVLTLEGDIDGAIGDWKKVLLGGAGGGKDKMSFDEALDAYDEEEEDEEDFFDTIMKRDLGEDYMKLVEDDDGEMDDELLKMFDAERLDGDLDDLMDGIAAGESKIADSSYDELVRQLQPSAALKLLSFVGPGGKEYSILRPLRPILLVGKEDPEDYTRRILLDEEERSKILPRLESACREGLEEAGFFLAGSSDET